MFEKRHKGRTQLLAKQEPRGINVCMHDGLPVWAQRQYLTITNRSESAGLKYFTTGAPGPYTSCAQSGSGTSAAGCGLRWPGRRVPTARAGQHGSKQLPPPERHFRPKRDGQSFRARGLRAPGAQDGVRFPRPAGSPRLLNQGLAQTKSSWVVAMGWPGKGARKGKGASRASRLLRPQGEACQNGGARGPYCKTPQPTAGP